MDAAGDPDADFETNLARTAASYEALPYVSMPYAKSHWSELSCTPMLDVSTTPLSAARLSDFPVASPHVIWDCEAGRPSTVNPRHELIMIDPISRLLLPLLDGTRNHDSLGDALIEAVERDGIQITHNEMLVSTAAETRRVLKEGLPELLQNFENLGLLID